MLENAEKIAREKVPEILHTAQTLVDQELSYEFNRLIALKERNPNIRTDEIQAAKDQIKALKEYIANCRISLDALRLIWRGSDQFLN